MGASRGHRTRRQATRDEQRPGDSWVWTPSCEARFRERAGRLPTRPLSLKIPGSVAVRPYRVCCPACSASSRVLVLRRPMTVPGRPDLACWGEACDAGVAEAPAAGARCPAANRDSPHESLALSSGASRPPLTGQRGQKLLSATLQGLGFAAGAR